MLDAQVAKDVRMVGGVRAESTNMSFEAYDPYDREGTLIQSGIDSLDWLPAASFVYSVTQKTNARLGISQTLARPQLREIAPFLSSSNTLDLPVQGNKDLKITRIANADIRFEYFPTLKEVLAFSFFYKHFSEPIEEVIIPGGQSGILTYQNAVSAELIGLELEGKKKLDFLHPVLANFSVISNLTLGRSRVDRGPAAVRLGSRPLTYQSPYVVNLALDYGNDLSGTDVRLLYNVYGARLTTVGQQYIPDVYEQPRNVLDATVAQKLHEHFEVKMTAQNLLGADVVFIHRDSQEYIPSQSSDGTRVLTPGRRDPVTRRYDPGRTVTLTATYTY